MASLTATRLTELVRSYFAQSGIEVVLENGTARMPSGGVFGLSNLAIMLRDIPEEEWVAAIASHFDSLLSVPPELPPTFEEAATNLRVRLTPVEHAEFFPGIEFSRGVGGGLAELLLLKLDVGARNVPPNTVEEWAVDPDLAWKTARNNTLWDEPIERCLLLGPKQERVQIVSGNFFASSMLLDLGRFTTSANGALAMIPNRDALLFCELDHDTFSQHLGGLLEIGGVFFLNEPGPITPNLYWWHQGTIRCIAKLGPAGKFEPEHDETFSQVLLQMEASRPTTF